MLILVRKVQQGIWIQGNIWVRVLSVDRDRVKLGIEAPDDVKVMRQELFEDDGREPVSEERKPVANGVGATHDIHIDPRPEREPN